MEELEQLRSQFQMMKEQLDKQEIISDRLLRQTFKSKVKSINSVRTFSFICAIFVIGVAPFAFHFNPVVNASWAFIIGTDVFMSYCVYLTYRMHKQMTLSAADSNLLEFAETAKKMKKDYQDYLKYTFPLAAVWVLWLIYEIFKNTEDIRAAIGTVIAMFIGGTIGGIIGLRQNKKVIAECQSIIDEIQGE
ncbi:MAG: hypothetical protein MJZ16_03000 [Bacteroidales bacterium]|nr:hypothetical protein [Bacteroidales bacterium]